MSVIRVAVLCAAVVSGVASACAAPGMGPVFPKLDGKSSLLVPVATKSQRREAWRICRARFGKRLLSATYVRPGQATCTYGQSEKKLRARAAARCKKQGLRLIWLGPINRKNVSYRCG